MTHSNFTTTYVDTEGRTVHAATHLACNGLGCAECDGLGFTKTVDVTVRKALKKDAP